MKRIRLIVMVVAVMVIGVVAIACFRAREPRYQGRTLSEWIKSADERDQTDPEWQKASHAVNQIGTNAIPFLMDWIQAEDSPLKAKTIAWFNKHAPFHFHIKSVLDTNRKATLGFRFLGSESKAAWPALVQLTYSTNPVIRTDSFIALWAGHPDKKTFLPVLTRLVRDPDRTLYRSAAYAFHHEYPEDAKAAGVYNEFPTYKPAPTNQSTTNQPPAK